MPAADPGYGVYIHWPFCAQKCPYCDFNSHVRFGGVDEARYLAALRRELDWVAETTGRERQVATVFIGGGTPSLMAPATVAGLLDHVAGLWTLAPGAEITLEANPGSVEAGRFTGYRSAGVNRVSLGVQALCDDDLRRLGRIHTVAEARAALEIARRTFDRFTFDLIYARPGQTAAQWRNELGEALAMAGDHLSLYQLTIEEGTPFAALHRAGRMVLPQPELAGDLYDLTQELTDAAGLSAYEISNHARPGQESRHNLLYWRYGAYAGIGPGAHGRLLRSTDGARLATSTVRAPEAWLAAVEARGHGMDEIVPLSRAQQADEILLMGLRIAEGLDLARLAEITGSRVADAPLRALAAEGLIEPPAGEAIVPTRRGRMVLDRIVTELAAALVPVAGMPLFAKRFSA